MEKEVFEKIIRDLSNMNYQGSIGLYSNNEPYIDQNILSKMEYERSFFLITFCTFIQMEVYWIMRK